MCKKWNGAIMSSLIGKCVCVSSGVDNSFLYAFKVDFKTPSQIGYISKRGEKIRFFKKHIILISDNLEECENVVSQIKTLDTERTKIWQKRYNLIADLKSKVALEKLD